MVDEDKDEVENEVDDDIVDEDDNDDDDDNHEVDDDDDTVGDNGYKVQDGDKGDNLLMVMKMMN